MAAQSNMVSRLTAVGLLLASLALMAGLMAAPQLYSSSLDQEIVTSRPLLNTLRRQVAAGPKLARENKLLLSSDKKTTLLLSGSTTGVAGANLQRMVIDLVKKHGGQATSFQVLPPKDDSNLVQISMSLRIKVDIRGLRDILFALETGTPLIFVDDLSVRSRNFRINQRQRQRLAPLNINLQISGFIAKKETS